MSNYNDYEEEMYEYEKEKRGHGKRNRGCFDRLIRLITALAPIIAALIGLIPVNAPNEPYRPIIVVIFEYFTGENDTTPVIVTSTPPMLTSDTPSPTLTATFTATPIPTFTLIPTTQVSSPNPPRIVESSTSGGCPIFSGSVNWEDPDGDIDYIMVSWGQSETRQAGEFPVSYAVFSNTNTGTWMEELHLSCVNPSGSGCMVQFQAFDKGGKGSNIATRYHICP